MKKAFSLLIVSVILFCFVGCDNDKYAYYPSNEIFNENITNSPASFEKGSINDYNIYTNEWANLKFDISDGFWFNYNAEANTSAGEGETYGLAIANVAQDTLSIMFADATHYKYANMSEVDVLERFKTETQANFAFEDIYNQTIADASYKAISCEYSTERTISYSVRKLDNYFIIIAFDGRTSEWENVLNNITTAK